MQGTKSTRQNVKDWIGRSKVKCKGQNMQQGKKTRKGLGNSKAKWKNMKWEQAIWNNKEERKEERFKKMKEKIKF